MVCEVAAPENSPSGFGQSMTIAYAGRKDEAQKQYAIAAGLDLSADDKAELARQSQSKV